MSEPKFFWLCLTFLGFVWFYWLFDRFDISNLRYIDKCIFSKNELRKLGQFNSTQSLKNVFLVLNFTVLYVVALLHCHVSSTDGSCLYYIVCVTIFALHTQFHIVICNFLRKENKKHQIFTQKTWQETHRLSPSHWRKPLRQHNISFIHFFLSLFHEKHIKTVQNFVLFQKSMLSYQKNRVKTLGATPHIHSYIESLRELLNSTKKSFLSVPYQRTWYNKRRADRDITPINVLIRQIFTVNFFFQMSFYGLVRIYVCLFMCQVRVSM